MEETKITTEIAVIEQLPIITEKIKEIGKKLDKRLDDLKLNELVCNEETRKSTKELRAALRKEAGVFESQKNEIGIKVNEPFEKFKKIYETEIKTKYQNADLILKNKIDEIENGIKARAKDLAVEYFEEYRASKSIIQEDYLKFEEINLAIGLDALTDKGALVKKIKDAIIEKVDEVERDLETISSMDYADEMKVEYLKHKKLSLAIKEVNDRHMVLDALKQAEEKAKEKLEQEEKIVEIVDEVLEAPIVQKNIEKQLNMDFRVQQEPVVKNNDSEIVMINFKVTGERIKLRKLVSFLNEGGYNYECK